MKSRVIVVAVALVLLTSSVGLNDFSPGTTLSPFSSCRQI
jgi:hypothetical protein